MKEGVRGGRCNGHSCWLFGKATQLTFVENTSEGIVCSYPYEEVPIMSLLLFTAMR